MLADLLMRIAGDQSELQALPAVPLKWDPVEMLIIPVKELLDEIGLCRAFLLYHA